MSTSPSPTVIRWPKERRTASDSLRAAVEKEVEKLLPHGKAQKKTVARALGMSTRTFSRRLAAEETTYEEVVDQLRRSLALRYLKDPGMSLSQISWLLGYECSSSFSHAFRRWTGSSPSLVRKGKPLPAAAKGLTAGQTAPTGDLFNAQRILPLLPERRPGRHTSQRSC